MDHQIDETELVPKKSGKSRYRQRILRAWDNCCAYCDEPLGKNATLDHVKPRSLGGETIETNLVACCLHCNSMKSSHDVFAWYRTQTFYCLTREIRLHDWITRYLT